MWECEANVYNGFFFGSYMYGAHMPGHPPYKMDCFSGWCSYIRRDFVGDVPCAPACDGKQTLWRVIVESFIRHVLDAAVHMANFK